MSACQGSLRLACRRHCSAIWKRSQGRWERLTAPRAAASLPASCLASGACRCAASPRHAGFPPTPSPPPPASSEPEAMASQELVNSQVCAVGCNQLLLGRPLWDRQRAPAHSDRPSPATAWLPSLPVQILRSVWTCQSRPWWLAMPACSPLTSPASPCPTAQEVSMPAIAAGARGRAQTKRTKLVEQTVQLDETPAG